MQHGMQYISPYVNKSQNGKKLTYTWYSQMVYYWIHMFISPYESQYSIDACTIYRNGSMWICTIT